MASLLNWSSNMLPNNDMLHCTALAVCEGNTNEFTWQLTALRTTCADRKQDGVYGETLYEVSIIVKIVKINAHIVVKNQLKFRNINLKDIWVY